MREGGGRGVILLFMAVLKLKYECDDEFGEAVQISYRKVNSV